jgi:hypothetical protein
MAQVKEIGAVEEKNLPFGSNLHVQKNSGGPARVRRAKRASFESRDAGMKWARKGIAPRLKREQISA